MNKKKFVIIFLISSNILTLCLLFFLCLHFDVPSRVLNKFGIKHRYPDADAAYQPKIIRIVMLGDSITAFVNWRDLLSRYDVANRGVGGDTTEGIINRLSDIYELSPEICFIMVGINDLAHGLSVSIVFMNYKKILKELKNKGITPIIQSTLYYSETRPNWSLINNKVDDLNKMLKEYALKEGIIFIDVNNELSRGGALDSIYTPDGVHLGCNGYVKWRDLILSTLTTN
ncbi:GDSL-type esterase/lipase family protein [Thermodesulfobacteriota bacterium]